MTPSLILAGLWLLAANIAALLPEHDEQVAAGVALVGVGVPLLGLLTCQNGPWIAIAALVLGVVELRWPAIRAARRHPWRRGGGIPGAAE